jgi:hypothetical protein
MSALVCRSEKDGEQEKITRLALLGNTVTSESWDVKENETVIAYFFQPFTITCLFNVSAKDLKENIIGLEDWNAITTNALKVQLTCAKSVLEKINTLDSLCAHQMKLQAKELAIIRSSIDVIMRKPGGDVLSEIQENLSHRHYCGAVQEDVPIPAIFFAIEGWEI